jgi:hypothetical protein
MSVLPQLERDLLDAANRRLSADGAHRRQTSPGRAPSPTRATRLRAHRLRLPALALGCVLASTTIALAASGVILTGEPVRPVGQVSPNAGEGVPTPGSARLLALRVADPDGGLPWGMRIVSTTRGELCLQIGRVENGQLGELGIDGVFHDDGRFHPLPPDLLPEVAGEGRRVPNDAATATVSCVFSGRAVAGDHVGVDRSAGAADGHERTQARSALRDIYYGLLGPAAVSVGYRAGTEPRTAAVLAPLGAYLIVGRTAASEQAGVGGESLGTLGDLPPSPPLTAITYRIAGRLCQRGPTLPPGVTAPLTHPCPYPHWPANRYVPAPELHETLHARLQVSHHALTGAELSFSAPLAVTSARESYVIAISGVECGPSSAERGPRSARSGGYSGARLGHDVNRGELVRYRLSALELFTGFCGRHPVRRRSATIEVLYEKLPGEGQVLVGSLTVTAPPGTRLPPLPAALPLRRKSR